MFELDNQRLHGRFFFFNRYTQKKHLIDTDRLRKKLHQKTSYVVFERRPVFFSKFSLSEHAGKQLFRRGSTHENEWWFPVARTPGDNENNISRLGYGEKQKEEVTLISVASIKKRPRETFRLRRRGQLRSGGKSTCPRSRGCITGINNNVRAAREEVTSTATFEV